MKEMTKKALVRLGFCCVCLFIVAMVFTITSATVSDAERHNATAMNRVATMPYVHEPRAGGVRILFIGNSITLHGPAPQLGWTNNWGMAASAKAKDYAHLVAEGISRKVSKPADIAICNLAEFERGFETYDFAKLQPMVDYKPEYVVVALGENVRALGTEKDRKAYRAAFAKLLGCLVRGKDKPKVVVKGSFWPNPSRDALMASAAAEYKMAFVAAPCHDDSEKAYGKFSHPGVAAHPGDVGMAAMAQKVLETFFPVFREARPVWAKGCEREINFSLRFKTSVVLAGDESPILVRMTGCSVYRLLVNGKFAGYGPARGPVGRDRVDEWNIAPYVARGTNTVEIDVAGYNVPNYYLPNQPSYLRAEIEAEGEILAATGRPEFSARILNRAQKVPRYSFQRPFTEVWNVSEIVVGAPVELVEQTAKPLLPRRAPYPTFEINNRARRLSAGRARYDKDAPVHNYWPLDRTGPTKTAKGYPQEECTIIPSHEAERFVDDPNGKARAEVWDFGLLDCGFVGIRATARGKGRVIVSFDEILSGGKVDFLRGGTANVVIWNIDKPGAYVLESFDPYAFRYARYVVEGDIDIQNPFIRTYKSPLGTKYKCPTQNPEWSKIFEAARETFRQNAVDVFTDCPGRERAGWLCDSFFTARTSQLLTGSLALEELFLENFLLAECPDIPKEMFPMCYPADHNNGNFIPNWAMWLVLELGDYDWRQGEIQLVNRFEPKVMALIKYLKTFENSDGLLEDLPKWVFVEWSEANALTKGVNYPSNMTWSRVLEVAGKLYGKPALVKEGQRVRETVRAQSWDGKWFHDQALRDKNGKLVLQPKCTETCQYYAFYFFIADRHSHSDLWDRLQHDFGPQRKKTRKYPQIYYSNAFIGNYLRLDLLLRYGQWRQASKEIVGYFLGMAEKTGTLWEHDNTSASCCHGFASYAAVLIDRISKYQKRDE